MGRAVWTPELEEKLAALIKQGLDGFTIADRLGIARSTVYCKASELRLQFREGRKSSGAIARAATPDKIRAFWRRKRRIRLAEKFPSTESLSAIVAATPDFPVTKLPAGAHLAWRPSWWKNFA